MRNPEGMSQTGVEQAKERRQLTREDAVEMLKRGESFERAKLTDIVLAGLALEGKNFRGADARGLSLHDPESPEARTDIRSTDWTDAEIGDFGEETLFVGVDATGASFGFTERLADRRARHASEGGKPRMDDGGTLFNFNGSNGDFIRTTWKQIDFGGDSGYEAIFSGADLSGSTIEGSDLTAMDFSQAKLDGAIIKDPISLDGMRIRSEDAESVARNITLSEAADQERYSALLSKKGAAVALDEAFGVIVVKKKGV